MGEKKRRMIGILSGKRKRLRVRLSERDCVYKQAFPYAYVRMYVRVMNSLGKKCLYFVLDLQLRKRRRKREEERGKRYKI